MSITIELTPEQEEQVIRSARARGVEPAAYAARLVIRSLDAEAARLPGGYVRPTETPEWVKGLKPARPAPEGTHWSEFVVGRWPGPETEEELLAAEKRIDDEDAGRI